MIELKATPIEKTLDKFTSYQVGDVLTKEYFGRKSGTHFMLKKDLKKKTSTWFIVNKVAPKTDKKENKNANINV